MSRWRFGTEHQQINCIYPWLQTGIIEKRGSRKWKVKPVVLIVAEGSKTEPKYFSHFRTRQKNIDVRVVGGRTSAGETVLHFKYTSGFLKDYEAVKKR